MLHAIPAWEDLPLALGEAEVPWATPLAPAIFPMLRTADGYDYIEANQSPTDVIRRDAILESLDLQDASRATMKARYDAVARSLRGQSPFQRTVHWWVNELGANSDAERNWARENPDTDRPATEAELFSNQVMPQFYRLCWQGLMARMLEGEVGIGNGAPVIRTELAKARETFDRWAAQLESELDFRTVPIRKLVAVQLGSVLAAAEYLARSQGSATA